MKIEELLPKGVSLESLPEEHQENLQKICQMVCDLEAENGETYTSNSGYRTLEHHEEIYRIKNEKRIQAGLNPIPVPMGSNHLKGLAVDLNDPKRKLQQWALSEQDGYAKNQGLYFEALEACQFPTPWLHIQIVPPGSGKRFFEP